MSQTDPNTSDQSDQRSNNRRVLHGVVTSDKMTGTITVTVERRYKHAKYQKYIRRHSKVHAHDEQGEAKIGDTVEIVECRPLSKIKRWRLVKIVERADLASGGAL